MEVATRYDVAYVACLHSVVAIFVHQVEGVVKMTLVVLCARRRLVVHHQLHSLRVCIFVQILDVEVGVRGHEVEHVALPHVGPVFPTYVPSLYKHLVESIGGGEVDVLLHLLGVGGMAAVGLHLAVVGLAELH